MMKGSSSGVPSLLRTFTDFTARSTSCKEITVRRRIHMANTFNTITIYSICRYFHSHLSSVIPLSAFSAADGLTRVALLPRLEWMEFIRCPIPCDALITTVSPFRILTAGSFNLRCPAGVPFIVILPPSTTLF